jgi:regulation of enolase protein 1 (concanavalin A-like superfamily)
MSASSFEGMAWLNPPAATAIRDGRLIMHTGLKSDFWQRTYYGFQPHSGHFLHRPWSGDFTLEATFRGRYETLYDQAGLMVRHDETTWMKCGIEFTDGAKHFSVVVTRGHSDWSAFRIDHDFDSVSVRVTRNGDALFIQYRTDAMAAWRMARLAYFPPEFLDLSVGLMACSPQREGFEAEFTDFRLGLPLSRDIH